MKKNEKNYGLTFQKETISRLNTNEMGNVKGGSTNVCWAVGGYITGKIVDIIIEHFSEVCTCEGTTGGMS